MDLCSTDETFSILSLESHLWAAGEVQEANNSRSGSAAFDFYSSTKGKESGSHFKDDSNLLGKPRVEAKTVRKQWYALISQSVK